MVQVNLRYTGTSIYLHIFIFVLLTLHMVSVDVNAVVYCQQWGTSEDENLMKKSILGVAQNEVLRICFKA